MKQFIKRNAPIYALAGLAMMLTEAITAALLWRYEPDHTVGVLYSALTCGMILLGLVVSGAAAQLKADSRAKQSRRAFAARIVSILLVLPTVFIGGGAMALKMEIRAVEEYSASAEYTADKALALDVTADSQARAQASANLYRATRPSQVRMDDPAWFGSVIAYLALTLLPLMAVGTGLTFAHTTRRAAKRPKATVSRLRAV
jgi:cytochrome bd-type quinol oxidase subunit 2